MYKTIVKRIARRNFGRVNRDEYEQVLAQFDANVEFAFAGEHALGGELHGAEAVRGWFERSFRLFPDLRLEPVTIVVSGGPWDTRVATRFKVHATFRDGSAYGNEGMQFLRLRWGRVVEDRLYEDTQKLVAALELLAEQGVDEAGAASLAASG